MTAEELGMTTMDPGWQLVWEGFDPLRERDVESSMTIGNGYLGTRGALEEGSKASVPSTLIAGVYGALPETGHLPELVVSPNWLLFTVWTEGEKLSVESGENLMHRRTLDMRRGALIREWLHQDRNGRQTRFTSIRFASLSDRHIVGMEVWITPQNYSGRIRVETGIDGDVVNVDGPAVGGTLRYLEPAISRARDSSGILFAMRTRETRPRCSPITIAMATSTLIQTEGIETKDLVVARGVKTSPLRAVETLEWDAALGVTYRLERLVSIWTSRDEPLEFTNFPGPRFIPDVDASRGAGLSGAPPSGPGLDALGLLAIEQAENHIRRRERPGIETIKRESEAAWETVWSDAQVDIDGNVWAQHAVRFAMYHLAIAANPDDEHVSISARTLSGLAYKGHVFWDTEIFMLAFFAFTNQRAARSLLMYRYWTLPGARGKARALGYRGALYAWESADLGTEATPTEVVLPTGGVIKIMSGIEEHHISADIPYAIWQYWRATGDDEFVNRYGAEIVLECARFWSSRIQEEQDGKLHIYKVLGPDEYHEDVDDDAFTNAMAAWTLEFALRITKWMRGLGEAWLELANRIRYEESEGELWRDLANRIYTGLDPKSGLIEQFQGFFKLEQIDLAQFEPRVAPMDILLGHDRIQRAQVVKQADVLMLFQLLPDRYSKEVVDKNFMYYEQRTGHGSSLSPSTHALIAARLGYPSTALRFFKLAAAIDLGNSMGNSSGGIHGASCGGLWQVVLLGFAGMQLNNDELSFDPHLPPEWPSLSVAFTYRGRHLIVRVDGNPAQLTISMRRPGEPVHIGIGTRTGLVSWEHPLTASRETGRWMLRDGEKDAREQSPQPAI